MVHATELIVLGLTKTGEKSLVVHTLSPLWGRRSFICGSSAVPLCLPLSLLDAEISENPRSDLWRARSIDLVCPLSGIRADMRKNTMSLFMSEVLFRTLRDGTMEDGLYEWCRASILTLDALECDFANYHLRWLLELAGALGFAPSIEDLAPFAGEHLALVRSLLGSDLPQSLLIPMTGEKRSAVASLLLDYIGYHTETRLNIRSLQVLREIYS